jgi:periplasmic protein TonB
MTPQQFVRGRAQSGTRQTTTRKNPAGYEPGTNSSAGCQTEASKEVIMFNRLVISGAKGIKTHKPWTVALSAIAQVVIVFVLILVPLIYTEALDPRLAAMSLVAPPPPQPPPPPTAIKTVRVRVVPLSKLVAPTFIPKKISIGKNDAPVIYSNGDMGVPGATGNILNDILGNAAAPPSRPVPPQRIRVGGNVEAGARVNNITPEYPAIAKLAHISGAVVLHAVIAKDGTIEQLEYVSGPPMLVKSAMDAVRQWRYKPYLLNGDPVEVETTIDVDFNFGG